MPCGFGAGLEHVVFVYFSKTFGVIER